MHQTWLLNQHKAQQSAGKSQMQSKQFNMAHAREGRAECTPAPGLVQMPLSKRCLAVRAIACMAASASPSKATCQIAFTQSMHSSLCNGTVKFAQTHDSQPFLMRMSSAQRVPNIGVVCACQQHRAQHTLAAAGKPPPIPKPLLSAARPWDESQAKGQ